MNYDIMVTVICTAYNHEPYIRQCLDGFVMQKTNFSYEVLINDDKSVDGTADIIREYELRYEKIIKAIYQTENQYSKGNFPLEKILLPRATGKYIALCEGDDYWTDPYKLQKQVDFLEANKDYGLIHTAFEIVNSNDNTCENYSAKSDHEITFDNLIIGNRIGTLTVCFRKSLFDLYIKEINPLDKGWLMGDYPLWLWISTKCKIRYFADITGVYRILNGSISHPYEYLQITLFELSVAQIREFFANKENKLYLLQSSLSEFYINALHIFYAHFYRGELKLLRKELKLLTHLKLIDTIRLWGLRNEFNYNSSKLIISILKWLKGFWTQGFLKSKAQDKRNKSI
jgi:glycosyltransferase involved in cell wall biosynthesis